MQFAKAMSAAIALKPRPSLRNRPGLVLNSHLTNRAMPANLARPCLPCRDDENEAFANLGERARRSSGIACRVRRNGARPTKPKFLGSRHAELGRPPRHGTGQQSVFKARKYAAASTPTPSDPQLHPLLGLPTPGTGTRSHFVTAFDVDLFPRGCADHQSGRRCRRPSGGGDASKSKVGFGRRAALGDASA